MNAAPGNGVLKHQPRSCVEYLNLLVRPAVIASVLVSAWIGFLFITRGTSVRHVVGIGGDGTPVAPAEPQFPLAVAMLTGTVLTSENRVELALNGDGTYTRLWDDLRNARRSVLLQTYYGMPGRLADGLNAILLERAAAGVRIFILFDAFGNRNIPDQHLDELRAAGIAVVPFRPLRLSTLYTLQNRSHVRAVVIDGSVGWTGGFGIDDKWLGDGRTCNAWRETNVRFEGPAVRQLEAAFAAAWTEATGVLLSGRATVDRTARSGTKAGLLYASPTLGSTAAERFLALSIAGASKTLFITNAYFAPDDNFVELLASQARRGIDVRLLVGGPRTDVRMARLAGRARYEPLLEAGARIYEWQPTTLHAKTFVVDSHWSAVGTMNFDNRSLALNEEVMLMVLDPDFGRRMHTLFLDDLQHAEEIVLPVFRQRPWSARIAENAIRRVTRLL